MNSSDPASDARAGMVRYLTERRGITDARMIAALGEVPRHLFVPGKKLSEAYGDRAIPTRYCDGVPTSSASAPAIVAAMLQQLDAPVGGAVLEIGGGTGYNAALLSSLVGPSGRVVTMEIDPGVADEARDHLAAAGITSVEVICGDGALGHAGGAPYDGIIVTAASCDLAPAWVDQLAPGRRLVVPLSIRGITQCVAFAAVDGILRSVAMCECGFMPLQGAMANTDKRLSVPGHPGVFVHAPSDVEFEDLVISEAMRRPGPATPLGIEASRLAVMGSLRRWITFHHPAPISITSIGPPDSAQSRGLPAVLQLPLAQDVQRLTHGILGPDGLSLFDVAAPSANEDLDAVIDLATRSFGDGGDEVTLGNLTRDWYVAGRPGVERLRIDAYPTASHVPFSEDHVHYAKHTIFVIAQ